MTSYTPSLRFAQPVTGDPAVYDQWGVIWDATVNVIEQALVGHSPIDLTGLTSYALTVANNAPDQARQMGYAFQGTTPGTCTVTLPAVAKIAMASNATNNLIILTIGSGATAVVQPGVNVWISSDPSYGVYAQTPPDTVPVGSLMQFAGASAPPRWLLCYGQLVSRTAYARLFAVIGTAYGAGDGSTTFGIPDLRGRAMFGLDNMGGTAAGRVTGGSAMPGTTLGGAGGSELLQTHTHFINDPQHTHTVTDPGHVHVLNDPGHTHTLNDPSHVHTFNDPGHAHSVYDPGHNHTIHDPSHVHGVGDPGHAHSGSTDAQGVHNHSVSAFGASGGPNAIAPGVIATGNAIFTSSDGNHAHNFTTSASGTGVYLGYAATGLYHDAAATGIGIYAAGTGGYNSYATTGVTLYANITGITVSAHTTGLTNLPTGTGITILSTGAGNFQNMPPAMMVNTVIYAGV